MLLCLDTGVSMSVEVFEVISIFPKVMQCDGSALDLLVYSVSCACSVYCVWNNGIFSCNIDHRKHYVRAKYIQED
jgi:hypothetical protein